MEHRHNQELYEHPEKVECHCHQERRRNGSAAGRCYQHIPEGYYKENPMPATTEQAVIMLSSHFYESRDGSTGGFFADNTGAAQQVWNTVNLLLRLDRRWQV